MSSRKSWGQRKHRSNDRLNWRQNKPRQKKRFIKSQWQNWFPYFKNIEEGKLYIKWFNKLHNADSLNLHIVFERFRKSIHRGSIDSAIARFENRRWRTFLATHGNVFERNHAYYWRKNASKKKQNKNSRRSIFLQDDIRIMRRRQDDPRWIDRPTATKKNLEQFALFVYTLQTLGLCFINSDSWEDSSKN